MTQRRTTRGRAGRKQPAGIEWIGGTASLPAYVSGEGEPYRPEALFWMGADGGILGSTVARPGELLPQACESLRHTIEQPMYGMPHKPARVRVASAELADTLRAGQPGIDVVCAPTPELDEMLAAMREEMGKGDESAQSYFVSGVEPDAMASFFKAAASLFRAEPWAVAPDDQSLVSITIEQLGLRDAAISVIGQMGQSFGLILFSCLDDFEAYLDAAELIELGEVPEMPPHFALSFERGAELPPELRKEITEHGWEVAGPGAYPWPVVVDADLVARPPTPEEVTLAEAIALALTELLAEKKALHAAWDGGDPVARNLTVETQAGELEVSLHVPYAHSPAELDDSVDVLAALADSSNFGLAKSLFMRGRDAGFDLDSREGMEAWMQALASMPLPPPVHAPSPDAARPASRKAAKTKKDKRKAARKARKRNR